MRQTLSERDGIGSQRQRDLAAWVLLAGVVIGTVAVAVAGRPELAVGGAVVGAVTYWWAGRV